MVEDNLPCRGGVLLSVVASRLRVGQGLGMLVRVVVQIGLDEHRRNAAEGAQDQGVGADGREVSHGVAELSLLLPRHSWLWRPPRLCGRWFNLQHR